MDIRQCAAFWNDQFQEDQQKRLPPSGQHILSSNSQHFKSNCRNTPTFLKASSNNQIQDHYPSMSQKADSKNQWTEEEEDLLFKLHRQQGNKWSSLALELPGRNENSIKNKFYSTLRKGFRKINKYITNIRRKTHPSQMSNNKLVKADFLTKLTAIADRKYEEKYEVKPMAVTLSQTVEQKLIQLARNHLEYSKNEGHQSYEAQQDLLQDIFEFRKNCKKRKGKKKTGHNNISSEESESNEPSVNIVTVKANQPSKELSFRQVQQKNQDVKVEQKNILEAMPEPTESLDKSVIFKAPLLHEKRQKSDDKALFLEPFSLLQSELIVEEEDPRNTFYDNQFEVTSKCNSSLHHIIDPSPSHNKQFNNFSEAFLTNIKRVEVSAHMSQASDFNRPEDMTFIDKMPVNDPNGVQFFKSSQLSRICESANFNISNKSESKMYVSDVYLSNNFAESGIKQVKEEYAATPSFMTESSCPSKKMVSRGTSIHFGDHCEDHQ